MKPRVVVSNRIHDEVRDLLADRFEVDVNDGPEPYAPAELARRCADADALLAFMTDRIDAAFLAACPRLKIVACALKGHDNFDVAACSARGVWVTIVPDLLTVPTAELAIGLAIALGRRILEGDARIRAGMFRGWRPILYGTGLAGATVGIVGMGAVGRAIARRLVGFEPRIVYFDPRPLPADDARALGAARVTWDELLSESDVIMLAVPLGADTFHMIDARALARVKSGARLVNAGRGSVVDEQAVAAALASGRLGGYAADVFEMEDWARPDRPETIPPALIADRVRTAFTPHIGAAVASVRLQIETAAACDIIDALEGRAPRHAVNRPRGANLAAAG